MDDRAALLEAIFAAPDDDAPRLIYADWLDEHDEPAQAALIRAQVLSPQIRPDTTTLPLEIWEAYLAEVSEYLATEVLSIDYSRGFLRSPLILPVERFRDISGRWWPRVPVRALAIDLTSRNIHMFVRIPYLTRLTELVAYGEDPHGLVIPILARCHLLRNLERLDLSMFTLGTEGAEALANSTIFEKLTSLQMPFTMRPNREAGRLLRRRFGDACQF